MNTCNLFAPKREFFDDLKPEYELFVNKSIEIASKIEQILFNKGIAYDKISEFFDEPQIEINKWFSGMHNFTLKEIIKIENILNEEIIKIK